jgi:ABC-type lipoprotein export system ATPase subunit
LSLDRGDFIFLVGPSGAGKTSLLHIMGLIHRPSRGSRLEAGTGGGVHELDECSGALRVGKWW